MLERGGQQPRWSLNYTVVEPVTHDDGGSWVMAPHFTHGEYVLSKSADQTMLCRSKLGDLENRQGEKTQPVALEGAALIAKETGTSCSYIIGEIFAYVETLEPLPSILGDNQYSREQDRIKQLTCVAPGFVMRISCFYLQLRMNVIGRKKKRERV